MNDSGLLTEQKRILLGQLVNLEWSVGYIAVILMLIFQF